MSKISVFGGTGFIGGTFCNLYSEDVVVISRESRDFETNQVLYFISTTTNQNVFKDLHIDIDTNLSLFVDVLNNCKDKDVVFNFISSGFVYGNDVIDARETDCCNPTGFYSITKRCAEQLLISFCKTFGINYRILRIGNVYGIDKTVSSAKNVLGYIIKRLKQNEDIFLYCGGSFLKDYMYVEDVCKAINSVIGNGEVNSIYNIASGSPVSFKNIIIDAKKIIKSKSNLIDIPFPEDQEFIQVKNYTLNNNKMKSLENFSFMSFDDGLQKIIQTIV